MPLRSVALRTPLCQTLPPFLKGSPLPMRIHLASWGAPMICLALKTAYEPGGCAVQTMQLCRPAPSSGADEVAGRTPR